MNNFICVTAILVSFSTLATIPAPITDYLENNKASIAKAMDWLGIDTFSTDELHLIANRMAEVIASIFNTVMDKVDDKASVQEEIKQRIIKEMFTVLSSNKFLSDPGVMSFKEKYDGKLIGDILRIKYGDNEMRFKLRMTPTGILFLRLQGIGLPVENDRGTQDCLWVTRYPDRPAELEVSWVGSALTACPLPKRSSKELLDFAEDIGRALKGRSMVLEDQSKILCNLNRKLTDFRILRIFQNKESVYKTYGYKFKEFEDEVATQTAQLRSLSLSTIQTKLESLGNDEKITTAKALFQQGMKDFAEAFPNNDSFADFMSWLWSKNCADYTEVYQLILEDNLELVPEFNKELYPKFYKPLS